MLPWLPAADAGLYYVYYRETQPKEFLETCQAAYHKNKALFQQSYETVVLERETPERYVYVAAIQKTFKRDERRGYLFKYSEHRMEEQLRGIENHAVVCYTGGSYTFRCVDIRHKAAIDFYIGHSVSGDQLDEELARMKQQGDGFVATDVTCAFQPCGYELPPIFLWANPPDDREFREKNQHAPIMLAKGASTREMAKKALTLAGYSSRCVAALERMHCDFSGEGFWQAVAEDMCIIYYGPGEWIEPHYHDRDRCYTIVSGGCHLWYSENEGASWQYRYCDKENGLLIAADVWHCWQAGLAGLCMSRCDNNDPCTTLWLDDLMLWSAWSPILNFDVSVSLLQSKQFEVAGLFKEARARQARAIVESRKSNWPHDKKIFDSWFEGNTIKERQMKFSWPASAMACALKGDGKTTRGSGDSTREGWGWGPY